MSALLFDTETTGTEDTDQIVEAAWAEVTLTDGGPFRIDHTAVAVERFMPSVPIRLGAMATHHLTLEDLAGSRPSSEFRLPTGTQYIIGHKVDFDWKMIGHPLVKRICTLALSRKVWPDLDSHTQSAVLYSLVEPAIAKRMIQGAHSAEGDVRILAVLLDRLCVKLAPTSWAHLHEISEEARVPEHITFGKHKAAPGEPPKAFKDLPRDYLQWMERQRDMDPYVLTAVRRALFPTTTR